MTDIKEEKIVFDFSKIEGGEEFEANALMQWLVNRAFVFDKTIYNSICANFNDTVEGAVAYEMACIINAFTGVKFYAPRKWLKRCRFYAKNDIVKPVSKRRFNKIAKKVDTLRWDVQHTFDNPTSSSFGKIFYGIAHSDLDFLAKTLYGWDDNKKAYLTARKDAIKAAKKEFKEQLKEAKHNAKNNHNKREG